MRRRGWTFLLLAGLAWMTADPAFTAGSRTELARRNEALFARLEQVHGYTKSQVNAVRAVFRRSGFAGQGHPSVSEHPLTPAECDLRREGLATTWRDGGFEAICGARYMAPLYDPEFEEPEDATVCIDQYEFPDIPCAYPVVWIRAREAALVCQALGKRLCDAHEWEGACSGRLLEPDYRFDLAAAAPSPAEAVARMRRAHNAALDEPVWAYGSAYREGVCGAASRKSPGCDGGSWSRCGSNTYPAGSFPGCVSRLGVYDLHGNAAEHMNLPLDRSQMAGVPDSQYGYTEMKGSWFIFDRYRAHADHCLWRAPFWHGSRVMDPESHHNYHLGFRCCKDVAKP